MIKNRFYKVRHIENLRDMVDQSNTLFGNKAAFTLKNKDGKLYDVLYSEFYYDISALGTALINLDLKDKRIAVISENRYDWCISYLATVNGTGIIVPLDKELHEDEILNLLLRSDASAVIFSRKLAKKIESTFGKLPNIKYYISMDSEADSENTLSLTKLLDSGRNLIKSGDRSFIDAQVDSDAMNMMIFTSGTTDLAKAVMLSHRNICSDIMAVMKTVNVTNLDSCLSILPLHHTYECSLGFLAMIYVGGTISYIDGLKYISKNFKEYRPSVLFTVPLLLENIHKKIWDQASKTENGRKKLHTVIKLSDFMYHRLHIDARKLIFKPIHETLGGNMRLVLTGAAAIDPEVSKDFENFGISVLQGYGLTECSPLVIGNRDRKFKHNSIGLPLPGVEIKIVNPDENGIGELAVKGSNLMLGYYQNEAATNKALRDGWLFTGDLGFKDSDGFYYITGRSKNVIVTKNGKNIFPEEVESYLNKSPYVFESLVCGKIDESTGETYVSAQIVPNFEAIKEKLKVSIPSHDDIMNFIDEAVKLANKSMPLYKRISNFTIRETEFVKTTTNKIKRYIETNSTDKFVTDKLN